MTRKEEITNPDTAWISIEDRFPTRIMTKYTETVLINLCNGKEVNKVVAYYDFDWERWVDAYTGDDLLGHATHWMPIPELSTTK